jgi:hypothetical protein
MTGEEYQEIKAAVKDVVLAALPSEVKGVFLDNALVSGEATFPAVYVDFLGADIRDSAISLRHAVEEWFIKCRLVVAANAYAWGLENLENAALTLSKALLSDRTLGGLVNDIVRTAWEPQLGVKGHDTQVIGVGVTLTIKKLCQEVI